MPKRAIFQLPDLSKQIWILALGRLLSQIGTGFTLFYAPIFFVNQVGLSPTLVGIALGSGSLSGIIGRFLGGQWSDSPKWGRRKTLLLSASISAIADVFLALTYNFPTLLIGNLWMGLGVGLYWPATEAVIVDLTTIEQRNEAFAITRLADSLGLSIGTILGGAIVATAGNYRMLFVIDGISFLFFFGAIYVAIAETRSDSESHKPLSGWQTALGDRPLMIYALVNILFTTYLAQIQSTMPLYFKNYVTPDGLSSTNISILFGWHIVFAALCQLPVARWLNRFSHLQALTFSMWLWGGGFLLVWLTGIMPNYAILSAGLALSVQAIAMVMYAPTASAFVADLAPESLRGIYLSINSQCWAIGYLIGPPLGGAALDRSADFAHGFWLAAAISVSLGLLILSYLKKIV